MIGIDNLNQESEHTIHNNICPNCNIEMIKLPIVDRHQPYWCGKYIVEHRFQYYCNRCEYLSIKYHEVKI